LSSITVATDDDDQSFYIDIPRPQKRYLSFIIAKGGATTAASGFCLLYGASESPITNTVTDEFTGEVHVSPIAGTA